MEAAPSTKLDIVDCDLASVKVGMKVKVVFKPTDGGPPVPMFTPVVQNLQASDGLWVPLTTCPIEAGCEIGRAHV